MIDESEWEDFRAALRARGLDPNDFEAIEEEDSLPAGGIAPITGRITIRNRKNGRERTYRAGFGSSWPAEATNDVQLGVFG